MLNNIDFDEVKKFSALAKHWWDKNGKCKPLHIINPLRVDYIQKQCTNLTNQNILDVGCGGGILTESLAKLGANLTGIDMSAEALTVAKNHAHESKLAINYQQTSVEEFAKQNPQQFDVIVCMELLEHVPNPQSVITACGELLKPNGKLFLSTINRNQKAKFLLIYAAEYIARLVPTGTHDFNRFIRPSELMDYVTKAKLTTTDIIGMEYHLLKNQFKLGENVDVNYILQASKFRFWEKD
ncbi:bifunctional 2-polyprenyl-6-hydroxyphenol methylase/3-demethylubiquinol 3-O-methyltransferase UbiG [Orbaceae bacterium ac157xtp]